MNKKRWLTLLAVAVCLLGMTAVMLSGCRSSKLQVSFDLNYEEAGENPAAIEVKTGGTYGQLPEVTVQREGYSFGGWYLNAKGDGDPVTAETVVTKETDHTLYAKWIGDEITVSFDLQGGTINGISTVEDVTVTVGSVYSMMAIPDDPERDNHSFLGWYYDPEGTEGPVLTSTKVVKTEDHTLYAKWKGYELFYDFEQSTGIEVFTDAGFSQFQIAEFNGSNQLKVTNIGTEKSDCYVSMWIPLKRGTRVTMDVTFDGELASEASRMHLFCYGLHTSGTAITEGLLDITESEMNRRWYHGNGYRAMQSGGGWFYGDEGNWKDGNTCTIDFVVMEDCAGLHMYFNLGSEMEAEQWARNAIYVDNIEFTPNYLRILEGGMIGSSVYGATEQGIYFSMADNELPYDADWNVYYDATTADNVKLIRDGKVYCVAETGCDNICKFGQTDYYLRLENFTIGAAAPITTDDMFIVEGDFVYGSSKLTIDKTYIYHNGTEWVFTEQLPEELAPASEVPSKLVDPNYGILRPHDAGATDQGIYFLLSDNGLPYGDWNVYYDATSEDNVKIIRDGKVYRIAVPGCDNICKFGKSDYYLRLENYTIGSYAPFTTDDIFIVEGDFVYEKSTLSINKTYIYHNGSAWVFTTKLPAALAPESEEPVTPEGIGDGVMAGSTLGATDMGIYFIMDDNGLPYGDWNVYYDATSADNVKIIRDGKVYRAALPGTDNICKFTRTDYYLKLEDYTIGSYAPISTEDIFIVEGDFTYEDSTLSLKKSYIYHDGNAWVFTSQLPAELAPESEEPVTPGGIGDGMMSSSSLGATELGIYFTMDDNGLPYGDWSVYYDATSADNVKIIRNGKTYSAALTGTDNICKFSATDYYLRLEAYTIGSYAPISTEDIFIVEGDFTYEDSTLSLKKNYIYHDGTAWVFAAQLPEDLAPDSEEPATPGGIGDGMMSSSTLGATDQGIYFTMDDNGLPYGDWSVYYDATSADNVKIIRNGKTYSAALTGTDNICKFSATDYYLRLEAYTIGSYAPISTDDIFIVEGDFTYEDSTLSLKTNYIYHDGTAWVFAAELPEDLVPDTGSEDESGVYQLGVLSEYWAGVNLDAETGKIKGIYATCAATDATYDGTWAVEYTPASAENYKLIRNGVTYNVGITGPGTLVMFGQTDLYLKQESHTFTESLLPIQDGDILVVEGEWTCNQDADSVVNITTTYILISGDTAIFSGTNPNEGSEDDSSGYQLGVLTDHWAGVNVDTATGKVKGIYATGAATDATYDINWGVEYTPASPENYKLIRNGATYNVGITGPGTLVMFGQTDLYLKQENHTFTESLLPIQDGDILVVEGEWTCNQDADSVVNITTTYILISNGTATFSGTNPNAGSEDDSSGYQLGVLTANAAGVNVDAATGHITGVYAICAATDATYNGNWSVEYTPVSAENYKLIRNGVTYNVGVPGEGTLVMISQVDLYLKQEGHTIAEDLLPIQDGDILVVEGQWTCKQDADSVVNIATTYILISDGTASFSDTNPNGDSGEDSDAYQIGVLSSHSGGVVKDPGGNITGMHVTGAASNATYNANWSVEYTPVSTENYKLIRNGVTYNVGVPGEGTLVMFGQTDFYLKQEGHTIAGELLPIQDGDILVVEGLWSCNQDENSVINITKTYILISNGTATFSATKP